MRRECQRAILSMRGTLGSSRRATALGLDRSMVAGAGGCCCCCCCCCCWMLYRSEESEEARWGRSAGSLGDHATLNVIMYARKGSTEA